MTSHPTPIKTSPQHPHSTSIPESSVGLLISEYRARALKAEARANEASGGGVKGIVIKPIAKSGGFRKGGFRNAFAAGDDDAGGRREVVVGRGEEEGVKGEDGAEGVRGEGARREEEESEDEDEGMYDPRRPTGCEVGCRGL